MSERSVVFRPELRSFFRETVTSGAEIIASGSSGGTQGHRHEGEHQALLSQQQAAELLGLLTAKQVEVLDMLVDHQTSKEIARELDLAPNTVDQRITAARIKWGLPNRKALIRQYTELHEICGKTTYGSDQIDANTSSSDSADDAQLSNERLIRPNLKRRVSHNQAQNPSRSEASFMLQNSDIRFGRLGRVGLALIFAFVIAVILAASLVIAETMARWL